MKLTPCQLTAKKQLYDYINDYFTDEHSTKNDVCWLQAPTGAGKTFIIARLIDAVCQQHPKTAVIFLTLSQGNLPEQASDKFDKYNMDTPWEYIIAPSRNKTKAIDDPHDLIAHKKYTWIIGISSLRSNTIILDKGRWDPFIEDLGFQNQNLLLIWDEAHIGDQSQSKINEVITRTKKWFTKNNSKNNFFTLKTTATVPKKYKGTENIILISDSEAEDDNLIKSKRKLIFEKDVADENHTFVQLIQKNLEKFKEVKKKYQKKKVNINPAILIQVNGAQQKKYQEWDNNLLKIQRIIEKQNLTWAVYTNREKKLSPNLRKKKPTLAYLAANDCEVDVIIFIYALATGWDIPRACFLLQLKELKSQTLNIQTIGRIKRNPTPGLSNIKNTVFDQYFLYSNFKEDEKIFWQRKKEFDNFKISILLDDEIKVTKIAEGEFIEKLKKLLNEEEEKIIHNYANKVLQQINYDNILLQLKIKKTSAKNTEIHNLLELKKIWDEYAFTNKKLKKCIEEKWVPQKNQKIYDWIWYCFFLEEKHDYIVKKIKTIWNEKHIDPKQRLLVCKTENQELKEYILIDNSKKPQVEIKEKQKEYFPYKGFKIKPSQTQLLPLDSNSEKNSWQLWSQVLENLNQKKVLQKPFICKNFRQLNIVYPILEKNIILHKQHPDIIIRFNYQQKSYTLLIEIKSLKSSLGNEYHIDREQYREKIASIKNSYPQISEKMYQEGKCGYFFILDKSEKTGKQITCWFKGKTLYEGDKEEECFSKIMNINKQCLIQ